NRLAVANVTAADAGNYSVIVSNARNSLVSRRASLAVVPVTPPGVLASNLYLFKDDTYGAFPYGSLLQGKDGNLYGLASQGGSGFYGSVFNITLNGLITSLYS